MLKMIGKLMPEAKPRSLGMWFTTFFNSSRGQYTIFPAIYLLPKVTFTIGRKTLLSAGVWGNRTLHNKGGKVRNFPCCVYYFSPCPRREVQGPSRAAGTCTFGRGVMKNLFLSNILFNFFDFTAFILWHLGRFHWQDSLQSKILRRKCIFGYFFYQIWLLVSK